MPLALARSPSMAPTAFARSVLLLMPVASFAAMLVAATSVRPASSSISWAEMCVSERNTASRGRSALPRTFSRPRSWPLFLLPPLFSLAISDLPRRGALLAGLARLAADVLAGVLDALRFVRVRDAETADLRGDLADDLFVHARDLDLLRCLDRECDAGGGIDLDRVREAERELELLALQHRTVAGPADLEVPREAGGHAGDHVGDQRARQPVQRAVLLAVVGAGDADLPILARDGHVLVERARELALRALHRDRAPVELHVDPARDHHGHASDTTHLTTRTPGPRHRGPCAPLDARS